MLQLKSVLLDMVFEYATLCDPCFVNVYLGHTVLCYCRHTLEGTLLTGR